MAVSNGRSSGGDGGDTRRSTASTSTSTSSGTNSTAGTGSGPGNGADRIIDPISDGDTPTGGDSEQQSRSSVVTSDAGTASTSGTGTGSGSSSSGARRTRTGSASRNATRQAGSVQPDLDGVEDTPRKTKVGADETVKLPENSAALIGDLWAMLFWIGARISSTPEVELTEPEQDELGKKTEALVKSLGKKKATAVMKQFGKFGPVVAFGGTLAGVAVPRIKIVQEKKKRGILQPRQQQPAAATPSATVPVASSVADVGGQGDARNTTRSNAREPRTRSFTAADFEKASAGQSFESQ